MLPYYIIVTEDKKQAVHIDSNSGGYPYLHTHANGAKWFRTARKAQEFLDDLQAGNYGFFKNEKLHVASVTVEIENISN